MKLKEDQARIKELLKDTITLLCKNGLQYKAGFSVEALIGITLDEDEVFLVNIKECVQTEAAIAKDKRSSVEVTVRKNTNHQSDYEVSPNRKHSRKRPPDSSPPSFDHASPAKHSRLHSEQDDASNTSSTHYQSEQSQNSAFNIKSEPHDDDELVFVKQEGGNEFNSSCSQGNNLFGIGQMNSPGHSIPMTQPMMNPNFSYDSSSLSQTGATSSDSLPGMSQWASSQPGQQMSAIPGSQGSQPANWSSSKSAWICDICHQLYSSVNALRDHKRGKHFQGDPFVCVCGETFMWRMALFRHKKKCSSLVVAVEEGVDVVKL